MKDHEYTIIRMNSKTHPMTKREIEILGRKKTKILEIEGVKELKKFNRDEIDDAAAIIVVFEKISGDLINNFNKLKIISRLGIGTDRIDLNAATEKGIIVTNCPMFCVREIADHIMAFILSYNRKVFQWDSMFRKCAGDKKHWFDIERQKKSMRRLKDMKLGFVGFGNTARAASLRAKSFGLKMYAFDPFIKKDILANYKVEKEERIEDIFKECDFISIHLPLNEKTYHMIDKNLFKLMKKEAVFINIARGEVVNEDDLIEALKSGTIEYAFIDVFENMKVYGKDLAKVDSPYFELDNVLLTPHIAACSIESMEEVKITSAENVIKVLSGIWPEEEEIVNKNLYQI